MLMIYKVYQYNAVTIKCTQCSQCLQSMYNLHLPSLSPPALNLGSDQSTSQRALSEIFLLFRIGLDITHSRFCTHQTAQPLPYYILLQISSLTFSKTSIHLIH